MTKRQKGAQPEDIKNSEAQRAIEQASGDRPSGEAAEREIETLLHIAGWRATDEDSVTEAEADLIFRAAAAEATPEAELARVRAGALRRIFGAEAAPTGSAPVPDDSRVARPSLIRRTTELKKDLGEIAQALHLDPETMLLLDRGAAQSVPMQLVRAAAESLELTVEVAARCLSPADGNDMPMAAHGRSGAHRRAQLAPREFLVVIEKSSLPEAEKRYWRDIVAAEDSASPDE